MLTDPVEIEIISQARQKNVRDPNRSRAHFDRIFADFLPDVLLDGAELIDLGPGQFDFGEMARARGAARVVGFDKDPAVAALGRHKGFEVVEGRLQEFRDGVAPRSFDGVFCKFSINAFWARTEQQLRDHIGQIASVLRPQAWSWIAPWNGAKPDRWTLAQVESHLESQALAFKEHEYEAIDLDDELARYYGIQGAVANHALFTRNLDMPARVANCVRL